MNSVVGLYHLRLLWQDLQKQIPDDTGYLYFNFERWKRIHDIDPNATVSNDQEESSWRDRQLNEKQAEKYREEEEKDIEGMVATFRKVKRQYRRQ